MSRSTAWVYWGRGLEWLAHHLGCTLASVIAIGDELKRLNHAADGGLGVAAANDDPNRASAKQRTSPAAIWKTVSHGRSGEQYILGE